VQGDGGEGPDDERVGKGGGEAEENGLRDGAADGDDEGGHHRLGVAGLQTVERAKEEGSGDENPEIGGALLDEVGKVRYGVSVREAD
jgi:hypothetical protein